MKLLKLKDKEYLILLVVGIVMGSSMGCTGLFEPESDKNGEKSDSIYASPIPIELKAVWYECYYQDTYERRHSSNPIIYCDLKESDFNYIELNFEIINVGLETITQVVLSSSDPFGFYTDFSDESGAQCEGSISNLEVGISQYYTVTAKVNPGQDLGSEELILRGDWPEHIPQSGKTCVDLIYTVHFE